MRALSTVRCHTFHFKRRQRQLFAVYRKWRPSTNTFQLDSIKLRLHNPVPTEAVRIDLLNDAFLGYRKHSFLRFAHLYSRFANDLVFFIEGGGLVNEANDPQDRSTHQENAAKFILEESVLGKYIKYISLANLLMLFHVQNKCINANHSVTYSFLDAISTQVSTRLNAILNCDSLQDVTLPIAQSKTYANDVAIREWAEYQYIFQTKSSLLNHRQLGFTKDAYTIDTEENPSVPKFILKTANDADVVATRTSDSDSAVNCTTGDDQRVSFVYNVDLSRQTAGKDCMISNNFMTSLLMCIFNVKYWQYGFPFDTWINQYYIQNCHYYHPLLLQMYIKYILALYDFKRDGPILCNTLFQTTKDDFTRFDEVGWLFPQVCEYPDYMYLNLKSTAPCIKMVPQQMAFEWHDVIDVFSVMKKFANEGDHTFAAKAIPILVKTLAKHVRQNAVGDKYMNAMIMICTRNDNVGGCEELLDALAARELENIDSVSILDVSNLLHAIYKNNMHNQELVDALSCKLATTDLSQFSLSALSQCIQTLGRIQTQPASTDLLRNLSAHFVKNATQYKTCSEAFVSNILWGFQRLHFYDPDFLEMACGRYLTGKRHVSLPNVNSLVISLTSLSRMEAFVTPEPVIEIYKLILKSISAMTLSTCQQVMTSIVRILENTSVNIPYHETTPVLIAQGNKVMLATGKHVVEGLLDQISVQQAASILLALSKCRLRYPEIIAPLLASIAGYQKTMANTTKREWTATTPHAAKKSFFAYKTLPPCPFNIGDCTRRLQRCEANHLVAVCESIFNLDFWSPYSLHLMLAIKNIIEMQLHDMRAIHILGVGLSFAQWDFRDFQVVIDENCATAANTARSKSDPTLKQWLPKIIKSNQAVLEKRRSTWYENRDELVIESDAPEISPILQRQQWKERIYMSCVEGLQRHLPFLSSSSGPLKKAKIFFDTLVHGIYVDYYPDKLLLKPHENTFMESNRPFLVLEHYAPVQPKYVQALLPENLLQTQSKLYSISRTESYYNFLYNIASDFGQVVDASNVGESDGNVIDDDDGDGDVTHAIADVGNHDLEHKCQLKVDEELEDQASMPLDRNDVKKERVVPDIFPVTMELGDGENVESHLSLLSYEMHRGCGAVAKIGSTNQWIYVDPIIGGYRASILLLNGDRHYLPHAHQAIYGKA